MKLTTEQLRSIVREAARRKLDLGPIRDDWTPGGRSQLAGPLTLEQLQAVVDEEFAHAVAERGVNEEEGSPPTGERVALTATSLMRRKGT